MPIKLTRNSRVIYTLAFFHSFMIIVPVIVPFFASKGLSLAEIFYLQAVYATTIVLLEAPSGYFADLFGRKLAIVMGGLIHGTSYFILNFADNLLGLVVFEIALGIASSLLSGADLALLYDTQTALSKTDNSEHSKGIANLGFIRSFAEAAGALLGGVLAMISFEVMVIAQSMAAWMCLLLALLVIEPPYKGLTGNDSKTKERVQISGILKHMLAGDPMLRGIVFAIPLYNLATFLAAWLIQPYWEEQGFSLALFGVLWSAQSLTTALANKLGFALEKKMGAAFALVVIGLLPIVGHLGLAFAEGIAGVLVALLLFLCRGLSQVILVNALNRRVPSEFRATANSLTSFLFRLAFITTGPLLGYVAEYQGLSAAFILLAAASILTFIKVMLPLIQQVKQTALEITI